MTIVTLKSGILGAINFALGSTPRPGILIVHGWQSNDPLGSNADLANQLLKIGYHTFTLALRGHAPSLGSINTVTRAEHVQDITEALQWLLASPEIDPTDISAIGTSYGGYLLSAMRPDAHFTRLALRVPALYPDTGWDNPTQAVIDSPDLKKWRSMTHGAGDSRALKGISEFTGDLLLVSSPEDTMLGPEVTDSYRASVTAPRSFDEHVIGGAGHVLTPNQQAEYRATVVKWFAKFNK